MKICNKCGEKKSSENFYYYSGMRGRLRGECKKCTNEYKRERRRINGRTETPEQSWKYNLKSKFGLSPQEYNVILSKQNRVCAICNNPCKSGRRLAVDHCHRTGTVRGLLCSNCNPMIGYAMDDVNILEKAIKYLKLGMEK